MARDEAAAAISAQFEAVFSFTTQFDFLSSIRFSQTLDKLLTFLPTEDEHKDAAVRLPVLKVASFVVIVSKTMDISRILRAPRTRIVTNTLKSLEMIRRISTHSLDICKELNDQNLPQIVLPQLDLLGNYPSGWIEENICRLTRSMLDFLAEINRRIPTARAEYRSADGVRIFLALTSSPNESIRLSATLLLSHIIGEKENDYINATERHLRLILNSFPRSFGPRRLEILCGLKSLISHDRNKDFFARSHLALLLEEFATKSSSIWSPEEEEAVYEILWILTFNTTSCQEISECSTLMKVVKKAATNGRSEAVKCNAKGVIWKMKESAETPHKSPSSPKKENKLATDSGDAGGEEEKVDEEEDEDEADDEEEESSDECVDGDDDVVDSVIDSYSDPLPETSDAGFVLLTYTPRSKEIFGKLQGTLKEAGYEVVSRCSLKDASIQSMAHAVKEASAVIFEVSPASKCCAWFREVLEMSHRLQKTLVPLLLETAYRADGWLGFVCGSNLVYDFFDENCMESSVGKVFLELNRKGKKCCSYRKPSEADKSPIGAPCGKCAFEVRHLSLVEKTTSSAFSHGSPEVQKSSAKRRMEPCVLTWSSEQVGQWLHNLGIPDAAKDNLAASGLDGHLLLTWHDLLMEAPDVFYQSARQELSLGLIDTLRLTKGLRGLVEGLSKSN